MAQKWGQGATKSWGGGDAGTPQNLGGEGAKIGEERSKNGGKQNKNGPKTRGGVKNLGLGDPKIGGDTRGKGAQITAGFWKKNGNFGGKLGILGEKMGI